MKVWEMPEIEELKVSETSQQWYGDSDDGTYETDGVISGHLNGFIS